MLQNIFKLQYFYITVLKYIILIGSIVEWFLSENILYQLRNIKTIFP